MRASLGRAAARLVQEAADGRRRVDRRQRSGASTSQRPCNHFRAARMERAALRPVVGMRDRALDRLQLGARLGHDRWDRPQQRARVGMLAARGRSASTGPRSTMRPRYMTATSSAISAMTPMSCVIRMHREAALLAAVRAAGRAPAPASSRRAPWSARRRSGCADRRRAPWRSSRAGAGRPTAGRGIRRCAAPAAGCRPGAGDRSCARARRSLSALGLCTSDRFADLVADRVVGATATSSAPGR